MYSLWLSSFQHLMRPHYEPPPPPPHLILDRVFPTIKGPSGGKSNLKTAVDLESLTLDVYVRLGQVLSLWKSAAHDSLAHDNSLDISPSVKQGDWILLNRRTCERNVNTHLMGPIIQIRFKSYSYRNHLRAFWRSGSYLTRCVSYMWRRKRHEASARCTDTLKASWEHVLGYTWFSPLMRWRINKNKDANYATMVLKVKKEAIDSHGLQMTLVA